MAKIALSQAPRELKARGTNISYRRLYQTVLDGDIPAENVNGRWYIDTDRIPEIAKKLAA